MRVIPVTALNPPSTPVLRLGNRFELLARHPEGTTFPTNPSTTPLFTTPQFDVTKQEKQEQAEIVHTITKEVERTEERLRGFEQMQQLKDARLTEETQRKNWHTNFASGPPSIKPLNVNVGNCSGFFCPKGRLTLNLVDRCEQLGTR
jgi:hypothetical protein